MFRFELIYFELYTRLVSKMCKNSTETEVLFMNNFFTPNFLDILFISFFPNGPYIVTHPTSQQCGRGRL